jgi:L-threonylcarbamoyladenylate synthase
VETVVLSIDPAAPDASAVGRAGALLRSGGLVAFPTETVYGLGANALDAAAVARVYAAKGRPAVNPLIVHVADAAGARAAAGDWPDAADRLAERFWPGPLTLVLPRGRAVPDVVTAGSPTVGVRVPAHPVALALLRSAGVPVAAPSANRSTELSPTTASHVLRGLAGRIDLILDAGPTAAGLESTVLDLTATPPRLLRPGPIAPADLEAVIGPVQRRTGVAAAGRPLLSPGLMARHYAPRTPLECAAGDAEDRVRALTEAGERVGWVRFGGEGEAPPGCVAVEMPTDPAEYAARLYAELHGLDAMGLDRIVVALPPDAEEWLAVRDRLKRAAQP